MSEASTPWDDEGIEKKYRTDYQYGIDCSPERTEDPTDEWNFVNRLRQNGAKWFRDTYFLPHLEASQKEVEELKKEIVHLKTIFNS
jgi:hypothetical protein